MATANEIAAVRKRRGYWVQRARKRLGMTQQSVGARLGYGERGESTVSRWEAGARPIPSDKLEPLARLLSLPPDYLIRPPLTDDERLDAAVRDAEALEREDWRGEGADDPPAEAEPVDELRRLPA